MAKNMTDKKPMSSPMGPKERALCDRAASECLANGIRLASRAAGQMYDDALRPSGLRGTQFSVLAALFKMGPSTVTDLGERLVLDRTTLSRNLRPLERRGLVSSAPGRDRRTRFVQLTDLGRETLARALPLWVRVQDELTAARGESRDRRLREDLAATVGAAQKR